MNTILTTLHTDMNKYLEKVAERFELEPGVFYDKTKHDIALSRDKGNQEADAADTRKRLGWGAYGGVVGGFFGAAAGHAVSTTHIDRAKPRTYEGLVYPSDDEVSSWKAAKPQPPNVRRPGLSEYLDMSQYKDPVTNRFDKDKAARHRAMLDEASDMWSTHQMDMHKWRMAEPSPKYQEVVKKPDIKPSIVNKLADKIGPAAARRVFTGAGLAAGGLGLGGLYYAFNSATPAERTAAKDAYITKAFKRHDSTINQLEGWE